jgi:hypothetical protein
VKRTAVIADYDEGGLKMLDVESFVSAQKIMWIKRLLKNKEGSWKVYPDWLLSKILGTHSFQCSTDLKNLKWMPIFYKQLFQAWNKTKTKTENITDPFQIRRQILWNNENIKISGKEISYKKWYDKGIIMLHDIVKENGDFKSAEELTNEFNIPIKVLEYNGLKSAIPQMWRTGIKTMKIPAMAISNAEQLFMNCSNGLAAISILSNKEIYWAFVKKKATRPICALKWCEQLNIDMEQWKLLYLVYAGTKDTKIKAFQYKVLNNLIPCNLYLNRIGRSNTNRCANCNELDDLSHYFVKCPEAEAIWHQLTLWWNKLSGQKVKLSERDIIIGLEPRNVKLNMEPQLNIIILAAKWMIYANKQLGQKTKMLHIINGIKQIIETLKYIAGRNQRLMKHEEAWGTIIESLK